MRTMLFTIHRTTQAPHVGADKPPAPRQASGPALPLRKLQQPLVGQRATMELTGASITGTGSDGGGKLDGSAPSRTVPFFCRSSRWWCVCARREAVCVCADKQLSEAEAVAAWEVREARTKRGSCDACGHSWRPRNPSTKVNRCPGCGLRGRVTYSTLESGAQQASQTPQEQSTEASSSSVRN
jgi:hypothetical protein